MTTTLETEALTDEWRDALEERGFDPDSDGAAMLYHACIDEGIEPDQLCDAYQGETSGWSEEHAGRNYAMELADEMGSVPADVNWVNWPLTCIDWDGAWQELSCDGFSLYPGPSDTWFVLRAV
jgi:hypothetical protein